jgi:hypothetical protein
MVEELVLVDRPVLLVLPIAEAMWFAVVHEHIGFLPQPP